MALCAGAGGQAQTHDQSPGRDLATRIARLGRGSTHNNNNNNNNNNNDNDNSKQHEQAAGTAKEESDKKSYERGVSDVDVLLTASLVQEIIMSVREAINLCEDMGRQTEFISSPPHAAKLMGSPQLEGRCSLSTTGVLSPRTPDGATVAASRNSSAKVPGDALLHSGGSSISINREASTSPMQQQHQRCAHDAAKIGAVRMPQELTCDSISHPKPPETRNHPKPPKPESVKASQPCCTTGLKSSSPQATNPS